MPEEDGETRRRSTGGELDLGGLRRRISAQYSEDGAENDNDGLNTASGPATAVVSHSAPVSRVTSSGHQRSVTDPSTSTSSFNPFMPQLGANEEEEEDIPAQTRKGSHDSTSTTRNVRFSTDIERVLIESEAGPANASSNVSRARSRIGPLPPNRSNPSLGLSVNIPPKSSSSERPAGPILGGALTRSPISRVPSSPKGRNRGYSLRRSLFNRSMNTPSHDQEPASSIELGPMGNRESPADAAASSTPPREFPQATSPRADQQKKPQGHAFVSVSPVLARTDQEASGSTAFGINRSILTSDTDKKAKGITALPNYDTWVKQKAARTKASSTVQSWYKAIQKHILRINELPPTKDGRHIDIDASRKYSLIDERTNKPYIGNSIRSSRYNVWNFLPRQLIAQFSKLANFYFLCVSILQLIPGLSTTGSYTTIVPLMIFTSISMAREGYDDLRRYRLDKEENNRETSVLHAYQSISSRSESSIEDAAETPSLGPRHWAKTKWKDVQVGDIIRLKRDEPAPADVALLSSRGENGIAYIETMALDGETNLKAKQPSTALASRCDSLDKLASVNAHVVVEDPNLDLYNFEGKVTAEGVTSPLSNNEVIYRGSILRNTSEVTCVVIYTGEECKIRMNANKNPRIKAPALQFVVNKIVVCIVMFVVALAVFMAIAYGVWADTRSGDENAWYLTASGVSFGTVFVSFIIMFNTMIPLSLYVSLEIVKVWQMILMNDIDMYDEVSDTPLESRTSTINEELGQISYVFSDKTGTLTDNSMKFRKMSVAGTAWLHDSDLKLDAINRRKSTSRLTSRKSKGKKPVRQVRQSVSNDRLSRRRSSANPFPHSEPVEIEDGDPHSPGWRSSARPAKPQPELATIEMLRYIHRKPFTIFARKVRFFLLSIAVCHTCLPETQEDGRIVFQAASPDELALVEAAQELGFMLVDRKSGVVTIKTFPHGPDANPQFDNYEVMDVIEFSSKRKRMSVVVRLPDQRVCVICKGADSIIMQRLRMSQQAIQKTIDIERRASLRKSMEASQVIARKSEAHDGRRSLASPIGRSSLSFGGRKSLGGLGRSVSLAARVTPIRDQVDSWLSEREREVDASAAIDEEENDNYYSPRPSGTFGGGRKSTATAGSGYSRDSMLIDEEEDLVEEALVVDEYSVVERTFQHINDFATEGLRTLLYGYRFLTEDEYKTWKKVYHDATTSLNDRQVLIEQAGEMIEKELELGGATAIEDKLQFGVPETIDKLRRANIKMWMLTGDKRETAINIGHSCRLIKDYSAVTVLDHETGLVEQSIAAAIVDISDNQVAHSVVVIDGQTLAMVEDNSDLMSLFLDLAVIADSVICCRASPSQKAGLVKAIRRKVKKSITLAIGDGANDIAMIQEAHVGIGITGKEGLQAARCSDYSIAQFRFLSKLLLVHGRWNYVRVCKYTVSTFWKEMTFYLTQAMFQKYVGYSGTSLYESWSLSMFNTLFTSLPVIILGIFEQDLSPATLLAVPELYGKGQRSKGFNLKIYLFWMMMAAAEASMIFYVTYSLFASVTPDNSNVDDLYPFGDLCFTAVVVLVSGKLQGLEMHNRTIVNLVVGIISIGGWALWNILFSIIYVKNNEYDVKHALFDRFGRSSSWWLTLIVLLICLIMLEIGVKGVKSAIYPSETDIFQELERDGPTRERFEQAAAMELHNSLITFGGVRDSKSFAKKNSGEAADEELGSAAAAVAATRASNRLSMRTSFEREREVAELLRKRGDQIIEDTQDDIDLLNRQRISIGVREVASRDTLQSEYDAGEGGSANASASGNGGDDGAPRRPPGLQRTRSMGDLFKSAFGSVKHV